MDKSEFDHLLEQMAEDAADGEVFNDGCTDTPPGVEPGTPVLEIKGPGGSQCVYGAPGQIEIGEVFLYDDTPISFEFHGPAKVETIHAGLESSVFFPDETSEPTSVSIDTGSEGAIIFAIAALIIFLACSKQISRWKRSKN